MLDLLSDGRVDFGTGRSSTRLELEGFNVDPDQTREMWKEALGHIVGAWTEEHYQADGKYWQMGAPRRVQPKPLQKPHPPIFGATSSPDGHMEVGRQGIGLCSFTVGLPPEELVKSIDLYRQGLSECAQPVGKFRNETAATFTMVHCAPTKDEAYDVAEESFEWYPKAGAAPHRLGRRVARGEEAGARHVRVRGERAPARARGRARPPHVRLHPRRRCRRRRRSRRVHRDAASATRRPGCDLLLCLVNPYNIPHDKVMQSIELLGKHVIPAFS